MTNRTKGLRDLFLNWLVSFSIIYLIESWDSSHSPLSDFAKVAYGIPMMVTGAAAVATFIAYLTSHLTEEL
jgi:hypothetical protein